MIDEAIWAWKKVVQLEPDNTQAKYLENASLEKYGKDAWEVMNRLSQLKTKLLCCYRAFRQAISLNPMNKAHYWLGMAYFETKDYHMQHGH